ncbi:hypothetical protein [Hymenobacter terricola]|uniref:hypothetical protein n=1 Tax=Hymenobacter terricola TaxID=2819236 RepID=UPI001B3088DE|nr:hypothetical protein [Hymenobacter terricola]
MKMALAIFLNAALLAVLLPWLGRQWRQARGWVRAALAFGLGARLLVGIVHARHLVQDAERMSGYGRLLTAQFWVDPAAAIHTLGSDEMRFAGREVVFYGMSNTFFFAKVLGVTNLASMGTNWLNAVYLSIFCFVGCWQLVRALSQTFPKTPVAAGMLAFVLWPSVIYWASGIVKESVVLGSGAWMLAVFIELFYGGKRVTGTRLWLGITGLLLLGILHFKMRYFFAVPLFGGLTVLIVVSVLQRLGLVRSRWLQVGVAVLVLSGGAWVASEVSIVFRLNKFTSQLMYMRTQGVHASAGKTFIDYPDLRPTPESVLRHVPQAIANTLTRPWLGESFEGPYILAGLENLLLLSTLAAALLAAWRGKYGHLPFGLVLALVIQCLALAALLGISTANLGTLHRYRSVMTPYLLLLLLQNDYAAAAFRRLGLNNQRGWPAALAPKVPA